MIVARDYNAFTAGKTANPNEIHKLDASGDNLACTTSFAPVLVAPSKRAGKRKCRDCVKIIVVPTEGDAAAERTPAAQPEAPAAPVVTQSPEAPAAEAQPEAPAAPVDVTNMSREEMIAMLTALTAQQQAPAAAPVQQQAPAASPAAQRTRARRVPQSQRPHTYVPATSNAAKSLHGNRSNPYRGAEFKRGTVADMISRAEDIIGEAKTFANFAIARHAKVARFIDDLVFADLTAETLAGVVRRQIVETGVNSTSAQHNLMLVKRLCKAEGVNLKGITPLMTAVVDTIIEEIRAGQHPHLSIDTLRPAN